MIYKLAAAATATIFAISGCQTTNTSVHPVENTSTNISKPEKPSVQAPTEKPNIFAQLEATPFPADLRLCPRMSVVNAPASSDEVVTGYARLVLVADKVILATAPMEEGCLSSGYGYRNSKLHKGVDYFNAAAVDVFSAADGVVLEAYYRGDYGNMVVIDHGNGVYSRYAHLETFSPDLKTGQRVQMGQTIGQMGNTAGYSISRHLHYEVLLGDYNTRRKSFGLQSVNVFSLPAAN